MIPFREPLSTVTSFLFIPPAVLAFIIDEHLVAAAFILLTVGTIIFHATDRVEAALDRGGMLTSLTTLALAPGSEAWGLVAFGIGLSMLPIYSVANIFILSTITAITGITATGEWLFIGLAVVFIAIAGYFRTRPGDPDPTHAAWHAFAAVAYSFVILAYF